MAERPEFVELCQRLGLLYIGPDSGPMRTLGDKISAKLLAGEGGRGIRKVESEKDLAGAFRAARNEAARFLGNPTLFVERWLEGVRHVEVQTVADAYGTTWAVGTRDCTIQRRRQKLVEESPAILPPTVERELL